MFVNEKQLKTFILDSGLVSRDDIDKVEKAASKSGKALSDALLAEGKVGENELRRIEAYILGIPFVSLKGQKIDFELLSMIPEPIARKHNIIAFKKGKDSLEVAMLDTDDLAGIDFVKKKTGLKILPRLTDTESVKAGLLQYQKDLKSEFGDIIAKETEALRVISDDIQGPETEKELKKLAEDLPIVRIVDTLLNHAILQNASDIHIEPMEKEVLIRYRIDGLLHDAMVLPAVAAAGISARIKVLSNLKIDEKRLPQDGRFKIEREDGNVSFRVSVLPTYYGEKIVMRLLKDSSAGFTLEAIGFHGYGLEQIHEAAKADSGMILVTGPTGSGKTTTLYTVLDILNTPDVNISTIEDPIEYQVGRINQTQVKSEIGLTFSAGLRSLVRQDPDIIMVGEIRDTETASLAVNAALTGHLVLSTLHTNSAAGAVPRLVDMKVEPFLLVSTLKVVIGQRLVRKLCGTKDKYTLSKDEQKQLAAKIDMDRMLKALRDEKVIGPKDGWDDVSFYKPKPNAECEDGFSGRMGIHEVLRVSSAIKDLVIKGATTDEIEVEAKKEGMFTMLEDGIFKAAQGVTTIEEVLRVVTE